MGHYAYEITGGILIFLSSLVSEAFPKRFRLALWVIFALLAIGYTVEGIHLDKEAATKAEGERTINQKETKELKTEVQGLKTDTSNLINAISGTLPMIASLNADIAALRRDAAAAKEHHDPHLIDNLERQAQAAQQQVDSLSHEVLALTMAPQVAQQLRDWEHSRKWARDNERNFEWEALERYRDQHRGDTEGIRHAEEYWQQQRDKVDREYEQKLKGIIETADFVRKEMLQRIPPQQQSAEDRKQEQAFAEAKNNPENLDRESAAGYLENLARRVPAPK